MTKQVKKNLKTGKLVFGKNKTLKMIRSGKAAKVFLASNCDKQAMENIKHYCSFDNIPIEILDVPNSELGVVCKKQFSISVLCLLK
ncbi:MAG: 50S ribosomal protein L30e [Candidatus Woesearchaeota archaeon]|nr:50S ribosomal protein L30e [Candidatus Woesearchaeota archaeon]